MIFYADFHCTLGFLIAPSRDRFRSIFWKNPNFQKIFFPTWWWFFQPGSLGFPTWYQAGTTKFPTYPSPPACYWPWGPLGSLRPPGIPWGEPPWHPWAPIYGGALGPIYGGPAELPEPPKPRAGWWTRVGWGFCGSSLVPGWKSRATRLEKASPGWKMYFLEIWIFFKKSI